MPYLDNWIDLFVYMDTEEMRERLGPDGYLTEENFMAMQPIFYPEKLNSQVELFSMFFLMDANLDGMVDLYEMDQYMYNYAIQKYRWTMFKQNRSTVMNWDEFNRFGNPWVPITLGASDLEIEADRRERFDDMDFNGDEVLTFEEVFNALQEDEIFYM